MMKRIVSAVLFWIYAIVLVTAVRTLAHEALTGWMAKGATMAGVAIGLLPWAHWLKPRIAWVLGVVGRVVMAACYLLVLMPIALLVKLMAVMRRQPDGASRWVNRAPLPHTLDASRLEY